jgi:hypothetical protein
VSSCYENIETGKHINCFVNVRDKEIALKEAHESQKRIEKSKLTSFFENLPNLILKMRHCPH